MLSFPVNCSGLSVKEEGDDLSIEAYPNPIANGDLHIKFSLNQPAKTHFFLYDSGGKLMKYTEADQSQRTTYSLSVEELPKGIYFLQVIAGSKRQSLLKNRDSISSFSYFNKGQNHTQHTSRSLTKRYLYFKLSRRECVFNIKQNFGAMTNLT